MKNFIVFVAMLFSLVGFAFSECCEAQQIFYNNAGVPSRVSYGDGSSQFINNFGANAPYVVERPRYPIAGYPRPVRPTPCCAGPRPPYPPNMTNRDMIMMRTMCYRRPVYRPYYYTYNPTRNVKVKEKEVLSRFDKNYTIPQSSQKKVSCGGMTYYNSVNPCQ